MSKTNLLHYNSLVYVNVQLCLHFVFTVCSEKINWVSRFGTRSWKQIFATWDFNQVLWFNHWHLSTYITMSYTKHSRIYPYGVEPFRQWPEWDPVSAVFSTFEQDFSTPFTDVFLSLPTFGLHRDLLFSSISYGTLR